MNDLRFSSMNHNTDKGMGTEIFVLNNNSCAAMQYMKRNMVIQAFK